MAEWLKAHDSKSCKGNTFGGSNPLASAKINLASATRPKGRTLPPFFVGIVYNRNYERKDREVEIL